jgi:hypothetical protein
MSLPTCLVVLTGQPPRDPHREAAMRAVYPEGQPGASGREAVTLSTQVSSNTHVVLYRYIMQCTRLIVAAVLQGLPVHEVREDCCWVCRGTLSAVE